MQTVRIFATMANGMRIVETATTFGEFVRLVLGFRRDPDVASLVWTVVPATIAAAA